MPTVRDYLINIRDSRKSLAEIAKAESYRMETLLQRQASSPSEVNAARATSLQANIDLAMAEIAILQHDKTGM